MIVLKVILAVVLFPVTVAAFILSLAWNFVMPLFGLPALGFWQAFALCIVLGVLASLLRR